MYRLDYRGGISIGMKEAQGEYLRAMLEAIDLAAREGFPNVIVLTGSKNHMSYEEGADNAVAFLGAVKAKADELDYQSLPRASRIWGSGVLSCTSGDPRKPRKLHGPAQYCGADDRLARGLPARMG